MAKQRKRYKMQIRQLTAEDIKQKLAEFESKYMMSSPEFYKKYNRGELPEDNDYFDWASFYYLVGKAGLVPLKAEG